jgi:hypothetical protein
MVATTTRSRPGSPHRRRRDSADGQIIGALLVIGGIGWFVHQVGLVQLSVATTLSALLITLGIGLVVTARRSGGAALVVVGLMLTVVLASASAVDTRLLQRGFGERTFTPVAATDVRDRYQLGAGSLTLDLTDVDASALHGQRIDVEVGMGELVVFVPSADETAIVVRAEAKAGEVDLIGQRSSADGGVNFVRTFTDPTVPDGPAPLTLDLDVGLGSIQVVRARL